MSVASLDQGCTGISYLRDVVGLGLCLECEYFKHSSQFKINLSSWSFKPGQYTISVALTLHLPRPKYSSWMSLSVAPHFLCGTTIQVAFKILPSSTVSSSLNVQ